MPSNNKNTHSNSNLEISKSLEEDIIVLETANSIQEIVSSKPGLLVRFGTGLMFMVLSLAIIACWFIKYPETISANAILYTLNAPKVIVPKISGKITQLLVTNDSMLQKNATIAFLESTALHSQVNSLAIDLDNLILQLQQNNNNVSNYLLTKKYASLGELQANHQIFIQAFLKYNTYKIGGIFSQKTNLIQKDIAILNKQKENLRQQQNLNTKDLNLTQRSTDANYNLFINKVISAEEYRQATSKLIGKQQSVINLQQSVLGIDAQQNQKAKEILDLKAEKSSQAISFLEAANIYKNQILEWQNKYILTAPENGKISFNKIIQANETVQSNVPIGYIIPANTSNYMQVLIAQNNFGEIVVGQKVLLKFNAYTWQEYGMVNGIISYINPLPTDSGYLANVILPNGLITSSKKQLAYKQGLSATAEIITKDKRLLERFYCDILKHIK